MGPTPLPPSQKRVGNLTAGAFDFSFATPSKGKGKEKEASRPLGAIGGSGTGAFQTPQKPSEAARRPTQASIKKDGGWNTGWGGVMRGAVTPIREMGMSGVGLSASVPISALGRGMLGEVKKEEGSEFKTPRKLTTLTSITTPWTVQGRQGGERPSTPEGGSGKRRRLGELEVHLPGTKVKEEREDLGRRVALRQMGEGVRLEGVGQVEEQGKDEGEKEIGVGISPRKVRAKWTGRGEPPLALRLNALLTTQSSSLTLFYTSLQHTLHPSISTHRTPTPGMKPRPENLSAPSTLEHIRTAPLRLRLIHPLPPRAHTAQLWLASVRAWPKPSSRLRATGQEEEEDWPEEVLVNFSQAAKGAAAAGGAGADIKVITGRWWDRVDRGARGDEGEEGRWEVGVWTEWSMLDMPMVSDEGESEAEEELGKGLKVVFVSRYLIAERR